MKYLAPIAALTVLAACDTGEKKGVFICPNGPSLAVTYTDDSATLAFSNGRTEVLPAADGDDPNLYARPGLVWHVDGLYSARLTDGLSSYSCDEISI